MLFAQINHAANEHSEWCYCITVVESTLKQGILKYKGKKIGFLIAHKMESIEQQAVRKAFLFDRIMEICRKWSIPYIYLWEKSYFNPELAELETSIIRTISI